MSNRPERGYFERQKDFFSSLLARLREWLKALYPSTRVAKLIHGYGSTGMGGAIREAVRSELEMVLGAGQIRYVIPGEDWRKTDGATAYWLDTLPALRDDPDLDKGNPGVTIVILSNPNPTFAVGRRFSGETGLEES